MSEHWKSTPKYWCKHCSCYVRDTKLERANHEATGRHQGALKRSLRDLHRGHEREEREKERARREIARLNGVVEGSASGSRSFGGGDGTGRATGANASEVHLKSQREQLAALGVAVPSDFRPEMAMPGEWTVTSTRVVEEGDEGGKEAKTEARATGVRKREETDEQKEEEEAMKSLFKKPRRWGRDSKMMPREEDAELDSLLGGVLPLKRPTHKEEEDDEVKKQEHEQVPKKEDDDDSNIKEESDTELQGLDAAVKEETESEVLVKSEGVGATEVAPVVFKKRKPKGIRSK